jgi:hypothetical protein
MNITPWEELNRRQAYKKYGRKIDEVQFKLPDGSISDFYIRKYLMSYRGDLSTPTKSLKKPPAANLWKKPATTATSSLSARV